MTQAFELKEVTTITAKIDAASYRKIKAEAALRGVPIAHLLNEALVLWVEQNARFSSKDGSQAGA